MNWKKLGLVFSQCGTVGWRRSSALTPTPYLLNDQVIRVYAGFRDDEGISRIGYVDVDASDPTIIIKISDKPVLDRGRDGCFDDNGVILGDVVNSGDRLRLYYVGFQQVKRAKFLAFTGLAESVDQGETFQRVSEAPVLDRSTEGNMIRAIHTALFEDGVWKIWYAVGDDWEIINGVPYPQYNIWYNESIDGKAFPGKGTLCVDVQDDEYRIGRPSVYRTAEGYMMFYTKGGTSGQDYFPGVAYSADGVCWERQDSMLGLSLSEKGFDDRHLCYPRLITAGRRTYCFYNGNNMGSEGFGVAELIRK
ncbi:hypothetical protein [Stutzerimonas xanthomarina]|jgi:hypothetical protein|uniref:hypothetical protein n=1 Tax=Stutzerimonas xanthomarina TaxID=271420 RepID=UPI001909A597|nr:hypothetical protein [Stutzerimonas xanthomarina]MBK3847252.1 hypothetical protein [Stutzerimonas xanthomarina]|tara:strand:- start:377 stop:1294 length:918 start_codon:yes stop_codon:yes gene_type:complete